jgi:hypothetical protein
MNLVAESNGFAIFFNCSEQAYEVYKDNRFLIRGFKYSEVSCYVH